MKQIRIAVGGCALGLLGSVAVAQTEATSNSVALEEVTVTATKRGNESLDKVPIAITALSQAALENKGAGSFSDYARSVPGLSFVDGGPGFKTYILRGINSTGTGVATVGQYVDDTLITGDLRQPDLRLYDVQRIEVLRGPQGTLYGSGSLSGTIRTISNAPNLERFGADILARGSSTDSGGGNFEGAGTFNVPLVDGKLALRATIYGDDESGFIDNVRLGTHQVNAEHVKGAHAALRWAIDPATTVTGNFYYQSMRTAGRNLFVTADGDLGEYKTNQYVHDPNSDLFRIYNLSLEHDFAWADLTVSSSYFSRGYDNNFDSTPYDLSFGPDFFTQVVGLSTPDALTEQYDTSKLFTNEVRLASHFGGRVEGVVGLFQQHIQTEFNTLVATTTPQGFLNEPLEKVYGDHRAHETKQYAAFGEVSYKFTDTLTGLVGARAFWADASDDQASTYPFGGFLPPSQTPTVLSHDNKLTPKFYLAYQPTDTSLYYTTVSQGFRIGGGNQNFIVPLPAEDRTYEPDSLWNYEVGTKLSFLDRRLQVYASAYMLKWSNIQVSDFTDNSNNAFQFIANAGKARVNGLELEVQAKPVRWLDLGVTFSFVDAKLSEDQPSTNAAFAGRDGNRFPNVPRTSGSAFVQVTNPVTATLQGFGRIDYSYTGDQGTQFNPDSPLYNPLPSYNLVNLRLGVRSAAWESTLFVNNLANTEAAVNILQQASNLTPQSTVPLRPRTVGVELRYHF